LGKETTSLTPVAATRMFHPDLSSAFSVDWGYTFHEGRQTGTRTNISYGTRQMERVDITYRTPDDTGVAFDELPFALLGGGGTAATGSTAFVWSDAWGGTAAGTNATFTAEFGDDVQNFEAEGVRATRVRMSASQDGMTQLEMDLVGRQSTKSAKTAVTAVDPERIPGHLWVPSFATAASGLAAASAVPNFLREWEAEWMTGWEPHFYADGNDYFGQWVESGAVEGDVRLIVDSNATAVSQFYDKGEAGTVDFLRLIAEGSTLGGGTAYTSIREFALIYENVTPLGGEVEGVNTYEVEARVVYDATWGQSIGGTTYNALADLAS
jgi:hypothetical protein